MGKEEIEKLEEVQVQFNNVLITSNTVGSDSDLILPEQTKAKAMLEVQTVIAVGPNVVTPGLVKGATVLLDIEKLGAKRVNQEQAIRLVTILFDKETGRVITSQDKQGDIDPKSVETGVLISDREILFVLDR